MVNRWKALVLGAAWLGLLATGCGPQHLTAARSVALKSTAGTGSGSSPIPTGPGGPEGPAPGGPSFSPPPPPPAYHPARYQGLRPLGDVAPTPPGGWSRVTVARGDLGLSTRIEPPDPGSAPAVTPAQALAHCHIDAACEQGVPTSVEFGDFSNDVYGDFTKVPYPAFQDVPAWIVMWKGVGCVTVGGTGAVGPSRPGPAAAVSGPGGVHTLVSGGVPTPVPGASKAAGQPAPVASPTASTCLFVTFFDAATGGYLVAGSEGA